MMVSGIEAQQVSTQKLEEMEHELEQEGIMVEKDMLVSLYNELEKLIATVDGVIYNVIKKATKNYAKRFMEEGLLDKNTAVDAMIKILKHYGYAKEMEVVEDKDNEMRIRGKGLLFGSALKGKGKAVDSAIAGFMAGWLESAWNRRVNVKEVACEAKGDPYCEFVIKVS